MPLGQVTPTTTTPPAPPPGIFGKITSGLDSVSKMVGAVGAAVSGQTPTVVLKPTPTGAVHEKDYTPYIAIGGVVLAGAGVLGYLWWKKRHRRVAANPRRRGSSKSALRRTRIDRGNISRSGWQTRRKHHHYKIPKSRTRGWIYESKSNAPRLGGGGRMRSFVSKCVSSARRRGFRPHKYRTIEEFCKATGAKVGRAKWGKTRFQKMAAAGRHRGRKIIRLGRVTHTRRAAANPRRRRN